ncbi:MAG: heme exporter protein CcmB [Silvibacterium sp.]
MTEERTNSRPAGGSLPNAQQAAKPRVPGQPALSAAKGPVLKLPYSLVHLLKDLRIEWRSRDAINSMLFFSLLVVVIFSLAFDPTRQLSRQISGPIICVAILFAAVSALNQAWARELRNNVLDAHRMSPAPASSLFLGKVLANFLFVSAIELLLAPLFTIFYNLRALGNVWMLLLAVPLGTWAILINGTFFAALSIRSRNRELLLPLILFPIFMPALLAMVLAISAILSGDSDPALWIKMLLGYDVIFTAISLLLFETILNAE